jgi:hypothetical protein
MSKPKQRRHGLSVRDQSSELVIFDDLSLVGHSFDAVEARVWRLCDGTRSPSQIAAATDLSLEAVRSALTRFERARLLEGISPAARTHGRRFALKMIAGAVSGLAWLTRSKRAYAGGGSGSGSGSGSGT